jgi:superoxide dismutase, Fe-Mn family
MTFELPKLPYAMDALAPHLSKETLEFHHEKHHAAYVTNLNRLIKGTQFENMKLEEIIRSAEPGGIFNNAGQHFNHCFYWTSMKPKGGGRPTGALVEAINRAFGDFESFKKMFAEIAVTHFGSGWAWLIKTNDGGVTVESTHDAASPIVHRRKPLMTCDVWEHAYYIDYRNGRQSYVEVFLNNLVNWDFASENFK